MKQLSCASYQAGREAAGVHRIFFFFFLFIFQLEMLIFSEVLLTLPGRPKAAARLIPGKKHAPYLLQFHLVHRGARRGRALRLGGPAAAAVDLSHHLWRGQNGRDAHMRVEAEARGAAGKPKGHSRLELSLGRPGILWFILSLIHLSMEILQARILEWVVVSFSFGSSPPVDRTQVSCIGRQILYRLSHQGSPTHSLVIRQMSRPS